LALLARARKAGVCTILATGTSLGASNKAIALADSLRQVYATAGVHPRDASQWVASTAVAMQALWQKGRINLFGLEPEGRGGDRTVVAQQALVALDVNVCHRFLPMAGVEIVSA
jgi:Tat protein secretion system quality control protein TatD with DNase activity